MNHDELKVSDLFWKHHDVDITKANQILIEVYRESKTIEDWEVPGTFIGIRIFEDGVLKEDIPLHNFGDYGLFSYTSVHRHQTNMEFAIDIGNLIANKIINGFEFYDFKIKKKLKSNKHIYLLTIPAEYEVEMPEPNEQLKIGLDFEMKEQKILQKKLMNPDYDTEEELEQLRKEFREYVEKKIR